MTSSGGARNAHHSDWSPLTGRDVKIWPDADGPDGPGDHYANDVAGLVRAAGAKSVRAVEVPATFGEGWDLADPLPHDVSDDDLRRMLDEAAEPEVKPKSKQDGMPPGFRMTERGLLWDDPDDHDSGKGPMFISSPFQVLAASRDDSGNFWGKVLSWKDGDGKEHEWAMPSSMLAGDGAELRRILLDGGLQIAAGIKARNQFTNFLTSVRVKTRARAVSSTGWYGATFVLPDGAIGRGTMSGALAEHWRARSCL